MKVAKAKIKKSAFFVVGIFVCFPAIRDSKQLSCSKTEAKINKENQEKGVFLMASYS